MPLFGSKKHDQVGEPVTGLAGNTTQNPAFGNDGYGQGAGYNQSTGVGPGHHGHHTGAGQGVMPGPNTNMGGPGTGYNQYPEQTGMAGTHGHQQGLGTTGNMGGPVGSAGYNQHPDQAGLTGTHGHQQGLGTTGNMTNDGMHSNPLYPSPNAPMHDGAAAPAGSHSGVTTGLDKHGNPIHPGQKTGGGGSALGGKIEHAVGTMIGSESMKAKGLAKEQEAKALKAQAAELNQAERLEAEALSRRERAVAHGAHPDHKHLGGHNPGAGATNVNEMGGATYGVSGMGGAGSTARGGY